MISKPERLSALEPFWGVWHLDGLIGEGSYGKVFTIHRKDMGETYHAAMKWISLPKSQSELDEYRMEGMGDEELRKLYRETVNQLREEIVLMNRLRGNSHIVSYDDHLILERTEEIGWEILIRMELLTPLTKHFEKGMTVGDVIKMGLDICDGLTLCGKVNVIHRDIKPDNIFLSDFGEYKLGDFGVARRMEQTVTHMSRQGTPVYMAPEVYLNKGSYDATVDLYSLGMVMHRMLNRQRLPFLSMADSVPTHAERNMAMETRMKGVPIPPPVDGGIALAKVICKACTFQAQKRYQSAEEMRNALLEAARTTDQKQPLTNNPTGAGLNSGRSSLNLSVSGSDTNRLASSERKGRAKIPKPQKKALWLAGIAVLCAVLLIGLGIWMNSQGMRDVREFFSRPDGLPSAALTATPGGELEATTTPRTDGLSFPNAQAEAAIRKVCGKAGGTLYPEDVVSVTNLNLNAMGITDLRFLKPFVSLRGLMLSENAITDISPLTGLKQLMFLYLADNQIADLSPLRNLRALSNLSIEGNPVTDLSALRDLSALQSLNASRTSVSDLEPLAGLSSLKSLYVEDTPLTAEQISRFKSRMQGTAVEDNAQPVITATPAAEIGFPNAKVETAVRTACGKINGNLSPEDAQAVTNLNLSSMGIEDLDFLKSFTALRGLNLSDNRIRDITPLAGMSRMMFLYLKGNQITDLTPLGKMWDLYNLSVEDNPVTDLSALQSLDSLQSLNASDTAVTDLSPLNGLSNLKGLYVDNTPLSVEQVSEFERQNWGTTVSFHNRPDGTATPAPTVAATPRADALRFPNVRAQAAVRSSCGIYSGEVYPEDVLKVTSLNLSDMDLEDIGFLQAFTSLRGLNLAGNRIRDISALTGLNGMVFLYLKGNQIVDLSPLQTMQNLCNLSLTDNPITDISALYSLTSLQLLDASGTLITSLSPLVGLYDLKSLLVDNTPLSEEAIAEFQRKMQYTKVSHISTSDSTATPAPTEAVPDETGSAATAETSTQHLQYQTIEGGIAIIRVDDTIDQLVIPDEIDNLPVVRIDDFASIGNAKLVSVHLPQFLEEIGENAFSECHSLTDINFPASLKSIGSYAFSFCFNLTNAQLPPLLKTIQNNSFIGCFHLVNVELPSNLETIEEGAFSGTAIQKVTLPDSVTSIGSNAFSLVDEQSIRYRNVEDGSILVDGFSSTYDGITLYLRKGSYAEIYARDWGYGISYMD